jgi:hypothetical protein
VDEIKMEQEHRHHQHTNVKRSKDEITRSSSVYTHDIHVHLVWMTKLEIDDIEA